MKLPKKLAALLRRIGLNDLRVKIQGETYLDNRRRLFKRDIEPRLRDNVAQKNSQRILIWSPFAAWYHTLLEFFISTHLRLRGHEVIYAACDGSPPHCAMDRESFTRPPCKSCAAHSQYLLSLFGLTSKRLSEFVQLDEQKVIFDRCNNLSLGDIRNIEVEGINIGQHAIRFLTTYFNGFVVAEENLSTVRRILAGEWISTLYAIRLLDFLRPDCVLMFSGNDAHHYGAFRAFKKFAVRTITWDESAQWSDGFYFAQNECAGDVELDDIWQNVSKMSLNDRQLQVSKNYVQQWRDGRVCGTIYHPSPLSDPQKISKSFGLSKFEASFLALPNVVWDSNVTGKNVGFQDMKDWLHHLIQWFKSNTDKKLLIRAHPAEKRVLLDKHLTREDSTLPALISGMFPEGLSDNISIIPSDSDVDTYVLGEMCDGVCAYSSNIALELALRGKKTWVAGKAFFRGKGFTIDVQTPEHLKELLNSGNWKQRVTDEERELALRFLHLWIFRYNIRIPWHAREVGTFSYPKVHFKDFKFLIPGRDPQLDAICDRILDGRPFLDIPRTTTARFWKTQELD